MNRRTRGPGADGIEQGASADAIREAAGLGKSAGRGGKDGIPHLRSLGMADFVTMGNAACGTGCIFLCLNYLENEHYEKYIVWAFVLLPVGLFCDLFDGWVARKRYASPFGGDLDSLSDLISFGVAPACLGFTLGLRGIWDSIILTAFVVCGLSRLARYNVTSAHISSDTGKVKYYEGMPIPGSLLLVILLLCVHLTGDAGNETIWGGRWEVYPGHFHPFSLLYLLMGLLMLWGVLLLTIVCDL